MTDVGDLQNEVLGMLPARGYRVRSKKAQDGTPGFLMLKERAEKEKLKSRKRGQKTRWNELRECHHRSQKKQISRRKCLTVLNAVERTRQALIQREGCHGDLGQRGFFRGAGRGRRVTVMGCGVSRRPGGGAGRAGCSGNS